MTYIRSSVLRARGLKPVTVQSLRNRAVRAETKLTNIETAVTAVNSPNGTTRKIARILADA